MKFTIILAAIFCAILLGGCADQSLMTDEEYKQSKGPAPYSPDFAGVLPNRSSTYNANGY
jgi:PBP1b-binding outer membrane lipoprotein LpoB